MQQAGCGSAVCLRTRTPSLEQAGGLQRMTLRGHTGGVKKVLLTPGGVDIITSETLTPHALHMRALSTTRQPAFAERLYQRRFHGRHFSSMGYGELLRWAWSKRVCTYGLDCLEECGRAFRAY